MGVRIALALAATVLAVGIVFACGDPSHVYAGRMFVEDRGCLASTSSIDVVEGDAPGSCATTCLTQTGSDGGRAVYLATMCAPYPYAFDAAGTDPACGAAFEALGRNDTCLSDGGSTHPESPEKAPDSSTP